MTDHTGNQPGLLNIKLKGLPTELSGTSNGNSLNI